MCLVFTGCYLAQNEETTDVVVMTSFTRYSIFILCWGGAFFLALLDLRALQKTLTPESSTGKTLKLLVPIIVMMVGVCANAAGAFFVCAFVPWLRHRAGIILGLVYLSGWIVVFLMSVIELLVLQKRKAAQTLFYFPQ